MSALEVLIVFVLVWWVALFTMLPVGVRRTENPEPGTEAGAPERAHMGRKALATTAIAGAVTALVYVLAEAGWLPLRAWLAPQG